MILLNQNLKCKIKLFYYCVLLYLIIIVTYESRMLTVVINVLFCDSNSKNRFNVTNTGQCSNKSYPFNIITFFS